MAHIEDENGDLQPVETKEGFVDTQIEIDDDLYCFAIEAFIRNSGKFSDATIDRFCRAAADIGVDREAITVAAGEAIFNEAAITILEEQMRA